MVSLSLMASLVEALRPDARLVLVGDPGSSPRSRPERCSPTSSARPPTADDQRAVGAQLERVTGDRVFAADPPEGAAVADGIVVLDRVHRFGEGIARLASAIRRGDADDVLAVLRDPPEDVAWIPADAGDPGADAEALAPIRDARSARRGR